MEVQRNVVAELQLEWEKQEAELKDAGDLLELKQQKKEKWDTLKNTRRDSGARQIRTRLTPAHDAAEHRYWSEEVSELEHDIHTENMAAEQVEEEIELLTSGKKEKAVRSRLAWGQNKLHEARMSNARLEAELNNLR